MVKKLVAVLSVLAVLAAVFVGVMLPASATQTNYQVGYARVDINPYNIDGDFSSGIMALPLRGSGDVWNRLSSKMVDDNGDGVIDANDGLKVTCIAVTDSTGNTVLFITVDLIGGTLYSKIATEIVSRVEAAVAAGELENVKLSKEQIFYAGTHTHNAPDTSVYASAGKTGTNNDGVDLSVVNENLGIWIERTVEDVGDAAILALKDRAAATVIKDQIAVSDATSDVIAGKVLNSTRHYTSVDHNGETVVSGDNFNSFTTPTYQTTRGDDPKQVTEADDTMYLLNFTFEDANKLPIIMAGWRGHPSLNNSDSYENGGRNCISSDFVNTFRHALEYGCEVTTNKDHATGYVQTWTMGAQQKYRAAYFQGNGGNVNPRGSELQTDESGNVLTYGNNNTLVKAYSWIDESGSNARVNGELKGRACSYGVVLAELAREGVEDGKNETTATAGNIQTMQHSFVSARKLDGVNQISYNASITYQNAASKYATISAEYTTIKADYDKLKNKTVSLDLGLSAYKTALQSYNKKLAEYETFMAGCCTNNAVTKVSDTDGIAELVPPNRPALSLPFAYKDSNSGETFLIASQFHANAIIGDWNAKLNVPYTTGTTLTLNTILLGNDLAFVVVPGEPFDYYFAQPDVYNAENNLWNILDNDATYGKPFVLGYANGASGYFPNYEAYDYNKGSKNYAVSSYEVHTSNFAQGTGEEMIRTFDMMLACMEAESYEATCRHCDKSVTWQPYCGETPLASGHYYLCSDFKGPQTQIAESAQVCFDLKGFTITGTNRAFYININAVFSLMDSSENQTGVAQGSGGTISAGYGGSTINAQSGSTFNFYSGNLKRIENGDNGAVTGGTVLTYGTFNMYGGTIHGGKASSFTGQYISGGEVKTISRTAMGGTVYISKGSFNMYGGQINTGNLVKVTGTVIGDEERGYAYSQTEEAITGVSPCVAVSNEGSIKLSNDAVVGSIYFYGGTAGNLIVEGNYTGTVELAYPSSAALTPLTDIGNVRADSDGVKADVSDAAITIKSTKLTAAVKGTDLVIADDPRPIAYCEGCKENVHWTAMTDAEFDVTTNKKYMPAGHYLLTENVSTPQKQLNCEGKNPGTFCVDLAGYTFTGETRAFYAYSGATLNIMDSGTGGTVVGKGLDGGGGTLITATGSTVNLYSGTVLAASDITPKVGGVVSVSGGTFNIYGGTVRGGSVSNDGGTIYISSDGGTVNVAGGQVLAGSGKSADCIYVSTGKVQISGDAHIDDIYYPDSAASGFIVDTSAAAFTGSVQLSHKTAPINGTDIGDFVAGKGMDNSSITLKGSTLQVAVDGTNLKAVADTVDICANDRVFCRYVSLSAAISAYTYDETAGNYIKLAVDTAEDITLTKDVYLDLNGCDITGSVTVPANVTLYCMDAQTDDYTITDDRGYGKLAGTVTGTVAGVPVETVGAMETGGTHRAGYLKVTESDGISFHRVNLQIRSMTLRPSCVGVYYMSNFRGDEKVADAVDQFGVALSVVGTPVLEGENLNCAFSGFATFLPGAAGNTSTSTGTLLNGIMKDDPDTDNNSRADMSVYGCAYILTENGYMQGVTVTRTLKEQVAGINSIWDTLTDKQKQSMLDMYGTYEDTMTSWNGIGAIQAAYGQGATQ